MPAMFDLDVLSLLVSPSPLSFYKVSSSLPQISLILAGRNLVPFTAEGSRRVSHSLRLSSCGSLYLSPEAAEKSFSDDDQARH